MTTLERKRVVITAMQRASAAEGSVSNPQVFAAAEVLDCTPRHIRRLIATGVSDPVTTARPTTEQIDILFSTHGNCAKAAREIAKRNLLPLSQKTKRPVSERTMRRALEEQVDAALLAAAREGWAGFRGATCYGSKYAPYKGHTYATDSTPFDVLVRDDKTGEVLDLWGTPVIDECTRFVIAENVTNGAPDTQTSVAVLAAAVQGYEADNGVWIGGLPERVLSDNGAEYKTSAVAAGLVRIGFVLVAGEGDDEPNEEFLGTVRSQTTPPGQPWKNGVVERYHRTSHMEFCSGLPGYVPTKLETFERLEKRAYWQAHPSLLLTRNQFTALLHDWLMEYNYQRHHSSLDGATPFEAWCLDRHILPKPDPEAVRLAMLCDANPHTVTQGKIKALSNEYYSETLAAFHGRSVEVRYLPGRTESVEIFHNGNHIATAIRRDLLTSEDLGRITTTRDKQTETVLAHMSGGEKYKTTNVNARLLELKFRADDLPEIPDNPPPPERPRTRSNDSKNGRRSTTNPPVTAESREALRNLVDRYTPDESEGIF